MSDRAEDGARRDAAAVTDVVVSACEYLGLVDSGPSVRAETEASGIPLRQVVEHLVDLRRL
jgi:hypothetical protein